MGRGYAYTDAGYLVLGRVIEAATGRTYYMLLDVAAVPPTVSTAGHYEDVFVRTADGWRIKQRIIKPYPDPELGRRGN